MKTYFWSVAKHTNARVKIAMVMVFFIGELLAIGSEKNIQFVNFKLVVLCYCFSDFLLTSTVLKEAG